jgi:hypothetical protein
MLGTQATYRSLLAVDIEKSANRGDPAMLSNREVLRKALREALIGADVPWNECHRSDLGDGFRLVVGRDVPKANLIRPTLTVLADHLREHNLSAGPKRSIRVRVALHAGDVHMDDGEVVGGSLEILARLLDAPPLRRALQVAPEAATVALAVSQHVYDEVVRHGYPGIDPETYRQSDFQVKETISTAWIHVPGHILGNLDPAPSELASDPGRKSKRKPKQGNPAPAPHIMMVTKGRARVGEQIGQQIGNRIDHVTGNILLGEVALIPETLRRQLAELRRDLTDERAAQRLDPETYEAATDEIRAADQYLSALDGPDRGRLLLALRRLKGLVEGFADLTAKVAVAITAARGL